MDAVTPILAEYGIVGVVLLGTIFAIRVLFAREVAAYEREKERADRMEAEVRRLNDLIQDKLLPAVQDATRALSEALALSRRRRDD